MGDAVGVVEQSAFPEWLARHGVAHTSDAKAAGFSPLTIRSGVDAGLAHRVGKSWVAAKNCDERKLAAAAVRGRVTCLSAAAMAGLWVPSHGSGSGDSRVHVVVPGNASRFDAKNVIMHWAQGPVPVGRSAVVDPMLNVLFHVARCCPQPEALAVWESAIRSKKIDPRMLVRVAWRSPRATALASVASDLSDSGLETIFVNGMRVAGITVRQQAWVDGHPLDGLIGERLAVQIDGFAHHVEAVDRRRDIRADTRLVLLGYTVLRFDYWQVLFDWTSVLATIQTAIAQGLHRAAQATAGPSRPN